MEVVANNYLAPGDQRLIDQLVYELKSQGIFDQFRKECFADVDTKPAYQNLRQRVEGSVSAFLKEQSWRPDMNKNQVREMLRKKIIESGYLETGVERIVDQVVNPKINTVFLPKVEEVVYNYLGLQKPSKSADSTNMNPTSASTSISVPSDIVRDEIKSEPPPSLNSSIDLLPTDLEAVSPESETAIDNMKKEGDKSSDTMQSLDDSSKMEEDESPPFEPLDEHSVFNPQEENSIDSHLSGFSGLVSHESNQSNNDLKNTSSSQMDFDISNPQDLQDSQMSQNSSDSRLSIVTSEDNTSKLDICEDSQPKSVPSTDSNSLRPVSDAGLDKKEENKESIVSESGEPSLVEDTGKEENHRKEDTTNKDETREDETKKEEIKRDEIKKNETKKGETKREETKKGETKKEESKREDSKKVENKKENSKSKESTTKSSDSSKHGKSRESKDSSSKSDKKEDRARKSSTSDRDVKSSTKHGTTGTSSSSSHHSSRDKDKDSKDKSKDRRSDSSSKGGSSASKDPKDKDKDSKDKSGVKEKDKDKDRSKGSSSTSSSSKHHHSSSNKEKSSGSAKKDSSSSASSKDRSDRDKDKNRTSSSSSKDTKIKDTSSSSTTSSKSKEKSSSDKHSNKDKDRQSTSSSSSHTGSSKKDKDNNKDGSKDKESSKVKDNNKDSSKDKHSNKDSSRDKDSSKDKDSRKRDQKKSSSSSTKDDHYSSKGKKFDRRSNDRDSNDEHSSSGSRNGSSTTSSSALVQNGGGGSSGGGDSSQTQKSGKDKGGSGGGGSGAPRNSSDHAGSNSDETEIRPQSEESTQQQMVLPQLAVNSAQVPIVPQQHQKVKLLKPKCASNIQEAMRLMKIRRQLAKLEKQNQLSLTSVAVDTSTLLSASINLDDLKPRKNGFLNSIHSGLSAADKERIMREQQMERDAAKDANLKMAKELVVVPSPLQNTVISQDNWDAMEAKLRQEVCSEFSSSYGDDDEDMDEYYVADKKPEQKKTENGEVEDGKIEKKNNSLEEKTEDNFNGKQDSEKKKNEETNCDNKKIEDKTSAKKKAAEKVNLSNNTDNKIEDAVNKTKDENKAEDKLIEIDDRKKIRTRRNGKQKSTDEKSEEVLEINKRNERNTIEEQKDTNTSNEEMGIEDNQDNKWNKTRIAKEQTTDKRTGVQKTDKNKNERKMITEDQQSVDQSIQKNNTESNGINKVESKSLDKELQENDETEPKKVKKVLRKRKMTKDEIEVREMNKKQYEEEVTKDQLTETNKIEGKSGDNEHNNIDKDEGRLAVKKIEKSPEIEHKKDRKIIKKRKPSKEKIEDPAVENNNEDYKIGRETLIVERLEGQKTESKKMAEDKIQKFGNGRNIKHEQVEDKKIQNEEVGGDKLDKNAKVEKAEADKAELVENHKAEDDSAAKKRKILDIVGVLNENLEGNNVKRRKTQNGNARKRIGRNKKVVHDIDHVEKFERQKSDEDTLTTSSDEENSSCKYFDRVDIDSIEFLLFTAKYIRNSETNILQRKKCQRKTRKRKIPNLAETTTTTTTTLRTKTGKEMILKDNNKINNNHLDNKSHNNNINKMVVTPAKKRRGNSRHKTENTCLIGSPLQNQTENDKSPDKMDAAAEILSSMKKPRRKVNQQRYSSDDLYKPRLSFVSSRRRGAKTVGDNN